MTRIVAVAMIAVFAAGPVLADEFSRVDDKGDFLQLVKDRDLKRFGIRLNVNDSGQITGRAFGQKVTGAWKWQDGFFCRDLYVGKDDLGTNCQMVEVKGRTMRFTSDRGQGIYADLRLK